MDPLASMRSEHSNDPEQNGTPRERLEKLEIPSPKTARSFHPSPTEDGEESENLPMSTSREFVQPSPSRLDVALINNISDEKKWVTVEELYDDLKQKVGLEIRKVCSSDPPKKKEPRAQSSPYPAASQKQSKKKKKRAPFEPIQTGKKLNAKDVKEPGISSSNASKDLLRIRNLLSGWGCPAAVNCADKEGCAPLMIAAEKGRNDLIEYLILKGADVNQRDNWGKTALHKAAAHGYWDICNILLNYGASINNRDRFGNTPLHAAIRNGQRTATLQLVSHGADPYIKNERGESPLDKAKTSELRHFIEMSAKKKRRTTTNAGGQEEIDEDDTGLPDETDQQPASGSPTKGKPPVKKTAVQTAKQKQLEKQKKLEEEKAKQEEAEKKKKAEEERKKRTVLKALTEPPKPKSPGSSVASSRPSTATSASQQLLLDGLQKKKDDYKKQKEDTERKRAESKVRREAAEKKRKEEEAKKKQEMEAAEKKRKEEEEKLRTYNLALKKRTWCTGVFDPIDSGEFGSEKAVDGDPNTRWCGHPPNVAAIGVDLGEPKEVIKIRIRFERVFAKKFQVEVGNLSTPEGNETNAEWKTISVYSEGHEGWIEIEVNPPEHVQLVKVTELEAAVEGWGMSIWELEVVGRNIQRPPSQPQPPAEQTIEESTNNEENKEEETTKSEVSEEENSEEIQNDETTEEEPTTEEQSKIEEPVQDTKDEEVTPSEEDSNSQ